MLALIVGRVKRQNHDWVSLANYKARVIVCLLQDSVALLKLNARPKESNVTPGNVFFYYRDAEERESRKGKGEGGLKKKSTLEGFRNWLSRVSVLLLLFCCLCASSDW